MPRAVVTGTGLVSPLGDDPALVTTALAEGRLSRQAVESYPPGCSATAAPVPQTDFARLIGGRGLKYHTRGTLMLTRACMVALSAAGLDPTVADAPVSFLVGSAFGNHGRITRYMRLIAGNDPATVQPMDAIDTTANSPVDFCAIRCGLRGAVKMIAAGSCSGLEALVEGARLIALGRAQQVLVAGFETLYPEMVAVLQTRKCTPSMTDPDPLGARPYCRTSRGMIPGEGAAAVVLENEHLARKRGVHIPAVVLGGDCRFSPAHRGSMSINGLVTAGRRAMASADCDPSSIDWICGAANGIGVNDRRELQALKQLFGEGRRKPVVSSLKASWGDALGAGGTLAAVAAVGCLQASVIPPTPGLDDPWPEARGIDIVTGPARTGDLKRLMVLGADADGFCAAVVMAKS